MAPTCRGPVPSTKQCLKKKLDELPECSSVRKRLPRNNFVNQSFNVQNSKLSIFSSGLDLSKSIDGHTSARAKYKCGTLEELKSIKDDIQSFQPLTLSLFKKMKRAKRNFGTDSHDSGSLPPLKASSVFRKFEELEREKAEMGENVKFLDLLSEKSSTCKSTDWSLAMTREQVKQALNVEPLRIKLAR